MIDKEYIDDSAKFEKQLIDICFGDIVPMEIEDKIIFQIYNSLMNSLKSISVLENNQLFDSAKIIVRSLFEQSLYMLYITEQNDNKSAKIRSRAFLEYRIAKDIQNTFQAFESGKVYKILPNELEKETLEKYAYKYGNCNSLKDLYLKAAIQYRQLFSNQCLKGIPNWYRIENGPRDMRKLAKRFHMETEYVVAYKYYSDLVHGSQVFNKMSNNDDTSTVIVNNLSAHMMGAVQASLLEYYGLLNAPYESLWKLFEKMIKSQVKGE